jgi:hypothetical protein
MGGISFVLLPLAIRFILTPFLFRRIRKTGYKWEDELSQERSKAMMPLLKKRLMSSERMNLQEDIKALIEVVSPADETGTIRLNFTPLRFLEIMLMAYEDVYSKRKKSFLLRYLLGRKIGWYTPFRRGYEAGRVLKNVPLLHFLNKKGIFTQTIRLALLPVLGIPGLLFFSIRSILLRLFWEGFIRSFYLNLLFRTSQYMLYLYGGHSREIDDRRIRFSKHEIIRKSRHFDRELSLIPEGIQNKEVLNDMIKAYERILLNAGLTPDPAFSLHPDADLKRFRFKGKVEGFLRKTISAVYEELGSSSEPPATKVILKHLVQSISSLYYPGKEKPLESYRLNQLISISYKLSIIALGSVYSNAPGSRFALEKMSVDLFRKVREFSKQPLITLLSSKGKDSWKNLRPFFKMRQILKLRKATPGGIAGLGLPLFGRILQDKGKEVILYRIGRALIRTTLMEESELPDP